MADTMGYAFIYPIVRLINWNTRIIAYTHYPTISSVFLSLFLNPILTMLIVQIWYRESNIVMKTLRTRKQQLRRSYSAGASFCVSSIHIIHLNLTNFSYYKALIRAYTSCLKVCDVNMANSSWTANHLRKLIKRDVKIVYPPCDTVALREFPLGGRQKTILCVAQFRYVLRIF